MSTIKSSDEHLTLNADGSSKDIKFQANGVEKASISSSGAFTSTTIDATKLTGDLPAISGAALTGVGVAGITSSADATAITIDATENVGIGVVPEDWHSAYDGGIVQINSQGAIFSQLAETYITNNVYEPQSGGMKYINTNVATLYSQQTGAHYFRVAPSGSADAAISWTEAMKIDNSGNVSKPLQPSFWASGTVASGNNVMTSNQEFVFSNAQSNVGSHYSTSTGRFTAPVAGAYLFSGTVYGSPAGASYRWTIKKNNTQFSAGGGSNDCVPHGYNSVNLASTCTLILQLAANDYVSCSVRSGQTCALYGGHSYFSGVLVG